MTTQTNYTQVSGLLTAPNGERWKVFTVPGGCNVRMHPMTKEGAIAEHEERIPLRDFLELLELGYTLQAEVPET